MALLVAGIYYSTLVWLADTDWGRADYSYGYMIPLVSLYLVWEKRRELRELPSLPSRAGFLALVPGLVLFWLGELSGEFFSLYLSFWLVIVGLCWINLGWGKLKLIAFPLVILLSMFPPPNFIHTKISLQLKLISSKLGVAVIQAFGLSAYREGNVIDLGFTQLQVVDACSGLRYLFPLMVMGLLLAYFYKAALWKKVVLVVSTVPLTIIINSLRIAATGVLYRYWGAAVAEGFFHGFSGWLIFIFALAVLLIEMAILGKIGPPTPYLRPRTSGHMPPTSDLRPPTSVLRFLRPAHFLVAVALLAATLAVSQFVEFREKVPITRPLAEFPTEVGEWSGRRTAMDQMFIDTLDLSDYVIVDYAGRDGKTVNFYVAYYESQRKGESIHSPETCLPGSGWSFKQAGTITIPLTSVPVSTNERINQSTPSITINRAFMENAGQRQLSYFWFPQRGRVLTNAYQLKLFAFWDALTKQRTDGALVRLITPVYGGEEVADAEERLAAFTQEILPILDQFIPK
ncbi:MAG: VPLPA-CTERM-specific exosortase XrtD [Deltaproteobacteria bacterium]|nr:VPLPA-CTERM-specific exosortase XrtD [Deltaproteobacteria bacterium]